MDEQQPKQINVFAKTNFRGREVPFGIKTDDRRRHMYVIGKSGMGKTTMLENMAIQDIREGRGVCFIDPHGDSVAKILNYVPSSRINDVIYFNPADLEHPIAFNILEAVDTKYKHLVASGLMGVFTKIWANLWSARMEYILNNTILALLESPGNTMLGITRMYIDKKYRKKIIDNIKDPMVRSFWIDEYANYDPKYVKEAVAPIQNKVGQFLSSGIVRNIVGQPKSTIDLRSVMDNRKVLLLDLSKGKVGEDNAALLGAMIVTKLQLAAMSRVDTPEHERPDFYLYVDEFQNFVTDAFATILSEARKYHLNLIVGHQYIGQLTPGGNTNVKDAVFGNVGTMVSFRIGAEDAEVLEKEFAPTYTATDLVNLPIAHVLLKLMINGVASEPFSATTLMVNSAWKTDNAEKVIKVSQERYANTVADVEEKISRWMGAEFHEQAAVVLGSGERQQLPAADSDEEPPRKPTLIPQRIEARKFLEEPAEQQSPEEDIRKNQPIEAAVITPKVEVQSKPEVVLPRREEQKREQPQQKRFDDANRHREERPRQQFQQSGPGHQKPRFNNDRGFRDNRNSHDNQRPRFQQGTHSFGDRKKPGIVAKARKQEQKKDNPIWDTVASMNHERAEHTAEQIFDQPMNIAPTVQNEQAQEKTVIEPGQVHKF